MNRPFMARQGDILITRIDTLPASATQVKKDEKNRFVLAEGEATGHAHAVIDDVDQHSMYVDGELRYLSVGIATALKHEEHTFIPLEPGIYEFRRQREYTPAAIRPVFD